MYQNTAVPLLLSFIFFTQKNLPLSATQLAAHYQKTAWVFHLLENWIQVRGCHGNRVSGHFLFQILVTKNKNSNNNNSAFFWLKPPSWLSQFAKYIVAIKKLNIILHKKSSSDKLGAWSSPLCSTNSPLKKLKINCEEHKTRSKFAMKLMKFKRKISLWLSEHVWFLEFTALPYSTDCVCFSKYCTK